MNLDQLKLSLHQSKSQLVVFDDVGDVLESCDSIVNVPKDGNVFDSIPLLESVKEQIVSLKEDEICEYKRMAIDYFEHNGTYNVLLKKLEWQDNLANLLFIEDSQEANEYLGEIQQGRNESLIHNEIIEEKNRTIEQNNIELASTLSALTKAQISKRALFKTFIIVILLVLLSEGLVDPAIETYTGSFWLAMLGKLLIALLIKPVDFIMEKILMKRAIRELNRQNG